MAKLFFEVFPTLKITGEISALLKETEITKVASNSAQNALRIYLESTRLIPKPEIYHGGIPGEYFRRDSQLQRIAL